MLTKAQLLLVIIAMIITSLMCNQIKR